MGVLRRPGRGEDSRAQRRFPGSSGYIDQDGDWVIAANYENARPFSEGLAAVQIEPLGSWGYIDPSGAVAIPLEWDGAWEFHGGLAWCRS